MAHPLLCYKVPSKLFSLCGSWGFLTKDLTIGILKFIVLMWDENPMLGGIFLPCLALRLRNCIQCNGKLSNKWNYRNNLNKKPLSKQMQYKLNWPLAPTSLNGKMFNLWLLQYLKIVQIGNHHTKCEANQNVNQPNWALRGKCHLKHLLAPGARFCARIAQWIWTYYKCTGTHTECYANARYLYTMWKTHLLRSRQVF